MGELDMEVRRRLPAIIMTLAMFRIRAEPAAFGKQCALGGPHSSAIYRTQEHVNIYQPPHTYSSMILGGQRQLNILTTGRDSAYNHGKCYILL